jgi:hypothetical protein
MRSSPRFQETSSSISINVSNALMVLPALLITFFVCIYGLVKIPELTASILSGRAGTWVNLGDR